MSLSRTSFILAHKAVVGALSEGLLSDQGIGSTPHNERARLLRNGLAVMIFSALEGFVRARMIEVLKEINPNLVPFASLPEGIQNMLSVGAIEGISNRIRYMKAVDAISVVQGEAIFLGSLDKQTAYGVSELAFGREKSNLSGDDLKTALASLGIFGDVWENIKQVSAKANLGGMVSPQIQFKGLSVERHRAAHNSSHQVGVGSLIDHARNALAFAIAFDILATTAKNALNKPGVARPPGNSSLNIKLLVIAPRNTASTSWELKWQGASKALRLNASSAPLYAKALPMLGQNVAILEFDHSNTPTAWVV